MSLSTQSIVALLRPAADSATTGSQSGAARPHPPAAGPGVGRRGAIELVAAMILSGTIGAFVLESHASPATVAFFRCAIGLVAVGAYSWWRGILRNHGYTLRLARLAAVGGLFLVVNWVLLFAAYRHTSIGIATVSYHVQPFILILLAPVVLRERITARQAGWVGIGFVGLVLIAQPWQEEIGGSYALGMLEAVGAALLYALATLIAKRLTGVRPHVTVLIQLGVGVLVLWPLVNWASLPGLGSGWIWLAGLGVIHTGVMYALMYDAYPKLPTPVIAVLGFVYPVVALAVDLLFFETSLGLAQFAGIAAILFAGVANTRGR